jgi:hypothetical protein
MKKKFALSLLVALSFMIFTTAHLSAIAYKAGTAAYSFLKIGVGARAVALGN